MARRETEAMQKPEFCVIFGANEGAALPLASGPLSVGRAVENDIVLDGAAIAAHHGTIELHDDYVRLETDYPVWMDRTPDLGQVEIGFDVPFRLGSCLCVVTREADAWFERDIFEFIGELFGHGKAFEGIANDADDAVGAGLLLSGAEAEPHSSVGEGDLGGIDPSLRVAPQEVSPPTWRRLVDSFRFWRVHDHVRFRRAVMAVVALALVATPVILWGATDRANAWIFAGGQHLTTDASLIANSLGGQAPAARDMQQEELEALVSLVNSDGRVEITRSSNGEFMVQGFVMSGNAYVRLLSGLSMLSFPVEMQVQNRGRQVKALELLVSHMKDANLEIGIDRQSGQIRVSGSFPTQGRVDEFLQQVKLELPNIAGLTLAVDSTDAVAREIAEQVRELGQIRVMRSETEVVITGAADASGIEKLDAIVSSISTSVPVHNRVTVYENQEDLRLTAGDLDLVAVVMAARPVLVDRTGKRFQVGDVIKGGFRIVDISFNEILVEQGTYRATVALN